MTDEEPEVFDLDALDQEGEEPERLVVRIGGEDFTLKSPGEVPWQKSMRYEQLDPEKASQADVEDMLSTVLGADQYKRFQRHELSARQFYALMERYQKHYNATAGGPGEAPASSTSSNGTARRSRQTSRAKG